MAGRDKTEVPSILDFLKILATDIRSQEDGRKFVFFLWIWWLGRGAREAGGAWGLMGGWRRGKSAGRMIHCPADLG